MSLPQTSLGMAKAQHRRSTIYSYERLATVTEKFTEKLNLSSYALFRSDIGASVGFRLAVMHCNFNSLSVTAPSLLCPCIPKNSQKCMLQLSAFTLLRVGGLQTPHMLLICPIDAYECSEQRLVPT